jgi:hypothetical protein
LADLSLPDTFQRLHCFYGAYWLNEMRGLHFFAALTFLVVVALLANFSPVIGWGDAAGLWALIGIRPELVRDYSLALILLLFVYRILQIGVPQKAGYSTPRAVLRAAITDIEIAFVQLTDQGAVKIKKSEWFEVTIVAAIFGIAFAIFLSKYTGGFVLKWPFDQIWHQAFVDYDAKWRTPFTSVPANVLYDFGIRLPLNSRSLPVLGLSELFDSSLRVNASYGLLFVGMVVLFWAIGAAFGLRPVPRIIFAGFVALMVVIPVGLNLIFWLLPPNFFTTQFLLATWWGEVPMLALGTIVAFYWIGLSKKNASNALAICTFSFGCYLAVIVYPAGAIYFIPLIAVYCAVFLFTSETKTEWIWKGGACAVIAAIMLAFKVPQFFVNLYSYTFGSYFLAFLRAPASALLHDTFMVAARGFDLRGELVFFVAIFTAFVVAVRGAGALRRFSLALLVCELAIVVASCANAFSVKAPLLFSYAETAHSSLWGSYFVLSCMAIAVVIDRRIASLPVSGWRRFARPAQWLLARRRLVYSFSVAAILLGYLSLAPRPKILAYPPAKPRPVQLLEQELALAPGRPFRGRAMTIIAPEGTVPFYAIALRYRQALGNDFYSDLLPFGIPTVNESEHWTSPVTFAFLYRFFAREGDEFEKNIFWLDKFNAKIARLIGVRMVVADSKLSDGTLLYERSVGDRTLRIYRLGGTNLGQYSPTHSILVRSAAAAIDAIDAKNFDPQRDVVVESDLPSDLVPAQSVSIVAETGPQLRIRAASHGRSLVVLPFEFSHCLRLSALAGSTTARILPVNLQQIGLLFDKEAQVSIDYRYGVFGSACRGADIDRANRLRLRAIVRPPRN